MRRGNQRSRSLACCLLLGWISISLSAFRNETTSTKAQNELTVAVHVSNAIYDCSTGIRFDWRIENTSSVTIQIYAPFLAGRAADRLEYDDRTGIVLIPTSLKGEVSSPPYSYPDPEFRPLSPGQRIEGNFHEPISSELSCKSLQPRALVFEVAWGKESEQVMREISRAKKEGRVHPANPIVHWANLAKSEPTQIKYTHTK